MATPMYAKRALIYRAFSLKTYFKSTLKHLRISSKPTHLLRHNRMVLSFGFSSLLAASNTSFVSNSSETSNNFEPNDPRLRSAECLKNAAGLAVDSTSAVLSQTVYAVIKIEQEYVELINVLIKLLEYQLQVKGHEHEEQRIEDIILETRHEIKHIYSRKQDLALLFSSAEKLADATSEVAFASGADYASTSTGERLLSAQREVQRVQALSDEAERRLMTAETQFIAAVSKYEERLRKLEEETQIDEDTDYDENPQEDNHILDKIVDDNENMPKIPNDNYDDDIK